MEQSRPTIDELMSRISPSDRYYWCESKICGCMGCANGFGQLKANGYTKEEWQEWVRENPEKEFISMRMNTEYSFIK